MRKNAKAAVLDLQAMSRVVPTNPSRRKPTPTAESPAAVLGVPLVA